MEDRYEGVGPAAKELLVRARQAIDGPLLQIRGLVADLVQVDICPYDNTADEEFIVERIDGIVVGAGTSGHAFKFGPLLGEQLAQLVLDD